MATKTITITEEAYEKLSTKKESNESFSDVINKITGSSNIFDLVGVLSHKEADELRKNIKEIRSEMDNDIDKRVKRIQ